MSGFASYVLQELQNIPKVKVPVLKADPENFAEYGNFVQNFDQEVVEIVPWNVSGSRKLMPGTGCGGTVIEDKFEFWIDDDKFTRAHNLAVGCDPYITGLVSGGSIFTREANYHPDGGQVFYPTEEIPFYLLLAKKGDDIKATDFVCFYFNGECGCQIKPGIWHQPPYLVEKTTFRGKQGAVHACIGYDSVDEEGLLLEIELI